MTIVNSLANQGPLYYSGSSVTLTCSADPRFGPFVTTWTSTCSGNCFVLQQSSQNSVTETVLHAADSGNHTCMVVDDVGNTGSAALEMIVSGIHHSYHITLMFILFLSHTGVRMYLFDDSKPSNITEQFCCLD